MKKLSLLLVGLICIGNIWSSSFVVNGISYNITSSVAPYTVGVAKSASAYIGNITIPQTVVSGAKTYAVTSISDSAFYYNDNLLSVVIPSSVTTIGENAFAYCMSMTSVVIPDKVTSIKDFAFAGCMSLNSITIPSSASFLGKYAFAYCQKLTSAIVPNGITSIGTGLFQGCYDLSSVVIPDAVDSIGESAFAFCSSLLSVKVPDGVVHIGEGAFQGCSTISSIVIPKGITGIQNNTFQNCTSLTSIAIPEGVTFIGCYAFKGCTGLRTVDIPSTVCPINNESFVNCSSLKSMVVHRLLPAKCCSSSFNAATTSSCVLYVPKGTASSYRSALGWENFPTITEGTPSAVKETVLSSKISVCGEKLVISNIATGKNVMVYTIGGVLLYHQIANNGLIEVKLDNRGAYIVKVGDESIKVTY